MPQRLDIAQRGQRIGAAVDQVAAEQDGGRLIAGGMFGVQDVFDQADGLAIWTMGSLTKATWPKLGVICLVILITLPIFAKRAWALTALRLGDDKAASFGINVRSLRFQTLIMVSLLASFPVAFVGTIGFIGLVGPHIARMLIGEDQRFFLPASLLTGSLILSASSVVSKTLIPGAIFPIGVVTSLIGVPFFISLILSGKKNSW